MERNNLKGSDVDWLVPHQANLRIIDASKFSTKKSWKQTMCCTKRANKNSRRDINWKFK